MATDIGEVLAIALVGGIGLYALHTLGPSLSTTTTTTTPSVPSTTTPFISPSATTASSAIGLAVAYVGPAPTNVGQRVVAQVLTTGAGVVSGALLSAAGTKVGTLSAASVSAGQPASLTSSGVVTSQYLGQALRVAVAPGTSLASAAIGSRPAIPTGGGVAAVSIGQTGGRASSVTYFGVISDLGSLVQQHPGLAAIAGVALLIRRSGGGSSKGGPPSVSRSVLTTVRSTAAVAAGAASAAAGNIVTALKNRRAPSTADQQTVARAVVAGTYPLASAQFLVSQVVAAGYPVSTQLSRTVSANVQALNTLRTLQARQHVSTSALSSVATAAQAGLIAASVAAAVLAAAQAIGQAAPAALLAVA